MRGEKKIADEEAIFYAGRRAKDVDRSGEESSRGDTGGRGRDTC